MTSKDGRRDFGKISPPGDFTDRPIYPGVPDFNNLLAVLRKKVPQRPTLFEYYLNEALYHDLSLDNDRKISRAHELALWRRRISAHERAGYDFTVVYLKDFRFPRPQVTKLDTVSLNSSSLIHDRRSFEQYPWPDPEKTDYSLLDHLKGILPPGMKLIICGPDGILENVIGLAGFERLAVLLYREPGLVEDLFSAVGSRLLTYYERCLKHESVGAVLGNDDWGFKTQTMISPDHLRQYVFPWHQKIVAAAHRSGRPAILHSCGNLEAVMDDIIEHMAYDAKHSFEDTILPVEEVYERWGGRIAILGGIDVHFLATAKPEHVFRRSCAMISRSRNRGGYALGSGNSIPAFIPVENYYAMINAALIERRSPAEVDVR